VRGPSPRPRLNAVEAWSVPWALSGRRGAWPIPWDQFGRRGGVARPLGPVWLLWVRGQSPGPCLAAVGAWHVSGCRLHAVGVRPFFGPCLAFVEGWPNPLAFSCRLGGVAGPLGPVWPIWGRGQSPFPRLASWGRDRSPGFGLAAVVAWPFPWVRSGCVGACPFSWIWSGRCGGLAGPLCSVWPPWRPGRSPWFGLASMGARPVIWVCSGRRGGMAGPLGAVWPPLGRGRSTTFCLAAVGVCRSPGFGLAAVVAWPVHCAPSGRRGGVAVPWCWSGHRGVVAGPLGSVWPPWGCGRYPGPRIATVWAWLFLLDPYECRGGVAGPLGLVWLPWGVVVPWAPYGCRGGVPAPQGFLMPPWQRGHSSGPRMMAVGAWPLPWAL